MRRLLALMMGIGFTACGGSAPPGIVSMGDIRITGEVDVDQLLDQMRQLDPRLEACYSRAKRADHGLEGVMELRLRGEGGRLMPEVTTNGTGSQPLAECVTQAIQGLILVDRDGGPPWSFEGDWSITFTIARRT